LASAVQDSSELFTDTPRLREAIVASQLFSIISRPLLTTHTNVSIDIPKHYIFAIPGDVTFQSPQLFQVQSCTATNEVSPLERKRRRQPQRPNFLLQEFIHEEYESVEGTIIDLF